MKIVTKKPTRICTKLLEKPFRDWKKGKNII